MRVCLVAAISFLLLHGSLHSQNLASQARLELLYKSAIEQMGVGQFGAARENFSQFTAETNQGDLRSIEAKYYLAYCALNLYHADAEKQFSDFVSAYPSNPKSILANYDLANFFYTEKNYKKASSCYSKLDFSVLTVEQQNTGRFRYGYSLFSQKSLKESLDQFNFIKTQGGQYGPAASYYAGFVQYSQLDFEGAEADLKRAEQNQAYSTLVPYLLSNVYLKQKKYDELIQYATQLKSKEGISNTDEITLLVAESYFKKGDYKNAVPAYQTYLEGKEDTADKAVILRAGYAAFSVEQDVVAIDYLKRAFSDSDSVGYYAAYYLGSLYLKSKQKPMALTSFDIARKYSADKKMVEEASFQFAKIAYELGRPDQAITEFEKILIIFPNSEHTIEIKELLSQAYVNASNFNKAIEYIESMPRRSESIGRAYQKATLLKAIDLFNKEEYVQANQFLEKSLQNPIDEDYMVEASYWNGETYSIQKKYELAAGQYLKVAGLPKVNPYFLLKARYGLGYCYFNLQEYTSALFSFKEFVVKADRLQQNYPDGVIRLADCYYVSKDYNEALTYYRKAISTKMGDLDYAHLQVGAVLGILRRYSEAIAELDLVIANYPTSSFLDEAHFQKGQINFEQGNYATAVASYTTLIKAFPSSKFTPYAYTRRAASFYNLKDYTKTCDDYIFVLTNYPNHPASKDVLLPLQESLNLAGRSAEFDKYLTNFKLTNPDSKGVESVEYEAAKNLYFNQDYARAIARLSSYVSQYPSSSRINEANYYLAESHYRMKDFSKAIVLYYNLSQIKSFAYFNKVVGRIGEVEFKTGKYANSVAAYHQLAQSASNKKDQYAAWNGLMESYFLLAQYDSANVYAQLILDKGSVNVGATNKASLYLGKTAKERGDFDTAKDELLATINSARDEYGAEAKYLLGEVFYLSKENKQCYETLVSLNTEFSSYPEWVGKSYLLLSQNFLSVGDTFNAKAVLKSLVANFPIESVRKTASERLAEIDQSELKKNAKTKADSLDNEK